MKVVTVNNSSAQSKIQIVDYPSPYVNLGAKGAPDLRIAIPVLGPMIIRTEHGYEIHNASVYRLRGGSNPKYLLYADQPDGTTDSRTLVLWRVSTEPEDKLEFHPSSGVAVLGVGLHEAHSNVWTYEILAIVGPNQFVNAEMPDNYPYTSARLLCNVAGDTIVRFGGDRLSLSVDVGLNLGDPV